jgi:AAA+ ATPase superfamily predicted ATPase
MNVGSEIIYRDEADELKSWKSWTLMYGRRKVGKTFLIKNFLPHDVYFRVGRDGKISAEKFVLAEMGSVQEFCRVVKDLLKQGKTVVIDEFQRLPESTMEEIATVHPSGKLIFCGSSLRVVKRIFGGRSPLLGLVKEYRLGLVRPRNILRELTEKMDPVKAVELAPYLSEVWTIPLFESRMTSLEAIYDLLKHCRLTIPALVGEIFTEEERKLTRVYEAILRVVGAGEWDYRGVASVLAGRGLIGRADSSLVLPYMKNLLMMGLLEELPLYLSKKKMYRSASSLMEAFYYLCDRYNFEEAEVSFEEVRPTLERLRNLAIQNWIADFFAEVYQGRKEYLPAAEKEVDFIITKRRVPLVAGEVKWGRCGREEVEKFKEKTRGIRCRKVLVTKQDIGFGNEEVEVILPKQLLQFSKSSEAR